MLPAAAGAWQVDEKTTALMFPSAGNAAMGGKEGDGGDVEGKEGLEREKGVEKEKGGQRGACSTPCPCTGSMEPPRPWDGDAEEGHHLPGGT